MNTIATALHKMYSDPHYARAISEQLFPTSISYRQGVFLAQLVKKRAPRTLIELGFGYGVSALWMNSKYRPKHHILVDPCRLPTHNDSIYRLIKQQKNITFFEDVSSQTFLANFAHKKKTADMVFVDADERFDAVVSDLFFITRILRINGIVVVRNVWNPSVRKALMFYCKNLPYRVVGFSKIEQALFNAVPFLGEKMLQATCGRLDFVVLQLVGNDHRAWDHFRKFY